MATVAVVAALIGALLGSGLMLLSTARREPIPVAAPIADVPQIVAPPVRAAGSEAGEAGEAGEADEAPDRVAAVAEAVLPSVVQVDLDDGDGNGSGVIYRSDGYVLTNNHVVADAERVEVVFADGARSDAAVVGTDDHRDLAVLRVDRTDLPAIRIGEQDQLQVGELAVALGSPFGLDGSVTAGVVSAINRGPISVRGIDGERVQLVNVIQTDAPINPGNSGGPLVDGDGALIGINSAILTTGRTTGSAGVGFAIPAAVAVDVAERIVTGRSVEYAFLGVGGLDVSPEIAERVGVSEGALVQTVEPGTPAADAGLRVDDVITAVDGEPIDSIDALIVAIGEAAVGDEVTLTYRRGEEERTVEVTLTERPS